MLLRALAQVCFLQVRPHPGTTLRRALPLSADSRYASAVALLVADGGSVEPAILLDREHFQRTRRNQGARTGCHTGQSGRRCGCRISRQWRKFREVPNYCSGVQVIRVRHRPIDDIRFIFAEFFSIPQSVPQNAVSCTSYEVLGSLHVSVSCSKTEYTQIHTVEVIGSNPIAPTIFSSTCGISEGAALLDSLVPPE
jgi:hypothetical protein